MNYKGTHIALCGFMGCGKSTHGKKLAKLLNRPFIDLDHYIEQSCGKTIPTIFNEAGEQVFREIESKSLTEVLSSPNASVIALGGGTPCFNTNLNLLKQQALLVYIKMPVAALANRLKNSKLNRPLLQEVDELEQFIELRLKERERFYNQSHCIMDGINLTPEKIILEINRPEL